MSLTVYADDAEGGSPLELGEAAEVFITSGVLHIPGHSPVASYHGGWWRTRNGKPSMSMTIAGDVELWFESGNSRSRIYGPFSSVRVLGGVIESGSDVIAKYDELWKTWAVAPDGVTWPDVVFKTARV